MPMIRLSGTLGATGVWLMLGGPTIRATNAGAPSPVLGFSSRATRLTMPSDSAWAISCASSGVSAVTSTCRVWVAVMISALTCEASCSRETSVRLSRLMTSCSSDGSRARSAYDARRWAAKKAAVGSAACWPTGEVMNSFALEP